MGRLSGNSAAPLWAISVLLFVGDSSLADPATGDASAASSATTLWNAHVEGLLERRCIRCHGGEETKSRLDLRTPESLQRGGKRGAAVVPGVPADSLLYRVLHPGSKPHMPPGEQLDDAEIALIEAWIRDPNASADAYRPPATTTSSSEPSPEVALPPSGLTPAVVIDFLLEAGWRERELLPAAAADDRTFVRRLYLDLLGRIPTLSETSAFLAETTSTKRDALVDRLLSSPEHARFLAEIFDAVLMGRGKDRVMERRHNAGWPEYLERAFAENRPWIELVRDVLLARPKGNEDRAAVWYLYERKNDHKAMAEAVAPAFFGVEVQCAQCHDHPLSPEIRQGDYWGLVAFFSRSKNIDTPEGPRLTESAVGGDLKFSDLKGASHDAVLATFTGGAVDETIDPAVVPAVGKPQEGAPGGKPTAEKAPAAKNSSEEVSDRPEHYAVAPARKGEAARAAVPKFSRRQRFVEDVAEKSQRRLAAAFVNRVWFHLMGRGLVHPVTRMDSAHPPSHPRLLGWLARDFEENGFDVRRLFESICRSRAYQLDSRHTASPSPPPAEAFAVAASRPLTAEALWRSLHVATGNWKEAAGSSGDSVGGATTGELGTRLRQRLARLFPDVLAPHFVATSAQALFFTNHADVDALLKSGPGNLVARVAELDAAAAVEHVFLAVLGRSPDGDERDQALAYLRERRERREESVRQLVWALISSAEFRLNH